MTRTRHASARASGAPGRRPSTCCATPSASSSPEAMQAGERRPRLTSHQTMTATTTCWRWIPSEQPEDWTVIVVGPDDQREEVSAEGPGWFGYRGEAAKWWFVEFGLFGHTAHVEIQLPDGRVEIIHNGRLSAQLGNPAGPCPVCSRLWQCDRLAGARPAPSGTTRAPAWRRTARPTAHDLLTRCLPLPVSPQDSCHQPRADPVTSVPGHVREALLAATPLPSL